MSDLMGGFGKKSSSSKSNPADLLITYEEGLLRLQRVYRADLEALEKAMQGLRKEREEFYLTTLPKIRQEMMIDEVLPEIREEWLRTVQKNIESSFSISEKMIAHYMTRNLKQFETQLREIMGQV